MKNDGSKLIPPIGSHKTEGIKWGAEDCKSLKCFLDGLGKFFIPPRPRWKTTYLVCTYVLQYWLPPIYSFLFFLLCYNPVT